MTLKLSIVIKSV